MIKTCATCDYYDATLIGKDFKHMHDWCWLWNREIPNFAVLDSQQNEINPNANYGLMFDDIECGIARCHGWKEADDPEFYFTEEIMKKKRQYNENVLEAFNLHNEKAASEVDEITL